MLTLPVPIENVLLAFAPLFTRPVWHHAQLLMLGAILARGKRTVTSALRAVGLAQERRFTNYHRVLNRAVWRAWFAAKVLLGLLVALLPAEAPLQVVVDETIERRNGDKIKTKGVFRDAVRSSRNKVVHCYGLRWVAMMLLVPVPWSRRPWALPFYTVQAPSQKTCQKLGKRYKSVIDRVCFALRLIRRWFPNRTLILAGDGAYAVVELIQSCRSLPNPVTLVARFRWNAALYDPPPAPIPGKRGRKPLKGKRQPSLKERLVDPSTAWEKLSVRWYNGTTRELLAFSGTSLWYTPGKAPGCHPLGGGTRPPWRARGHAHPLHRPGRNGATDHRMVRAPMEHRGYVRRVASSPWRGNPATMVRPCYRAHHPLSLRVVLLGNANGRTHGHGWAASRGTDRLVSKRASDLLGRHRLRPP